MGQMEAGEKGSLSETAVVMAWFRRQGQMIRILV